MASRPDELKYALILIVIVLIILLCLLWTFVEEGRELQRSWDCMYDGKSCPDYHVDLKALKKALDRSKCKHIETIFTSLKDHDP